MRSAKRLSTQKFYVIMVLFYVLLAGMGAFYAYKDYHLRAFTDRQKAVLFAVEDRLPYRCDKESRTESKGFESCRLGEPGKAGHKKILLAGDSHADAIKVVFMKLLPEYGHDLYIMKPNDNPGQGGHDADYFLNEAKKRKITDLVLHGYIRDQSTLDEMEKIIASAKKLNIRVSIMDPTPVFERSVVTDVYLGKYSNLNRAGYREQNKDYFVWRERMQKKFPFVRFYGVEKKLCPDMCPFEIGGRVLYFDAHHLTVSGTMLLAPAVRSIYGS